ncbi:MAG: glycosyltransferase family 4 protein [Armatimonadetes bacterium]|nr:glycosyltransferase family 4 protein [Armatimonadota bacterium]
MARGQHRGSAAAPSGGFKYGTGNRTAAAAANFDAAGHAVKYAEDIMRVLQITYSYKPLRGGADLYADDLCRVLEEAGHTVAVLQKPPAPADDPAVITYPRAFGVFKPFWLLPLSLPLIRRTVRSFDVVICHYPNYCLFTPCHPRLIGLSHGVTWDDAPGTLRSRIKRAAAMTAFRRCSRFVANDTFFLREMGVELAPGERAFSEVVPGAWFIPNCVDVATFCPGRPSEEAAGYRPFILVPRNIYWNRGVHLAVEAFAAIAAEWPEMRLVVVGHPGQKSAVQAAHQAVQRNRLEGRVVFAGGRTRQELIGWYRAAQLTVIPSLCGEGTSLAALESMACGTPVVATTAGGLLDIPCLHAQPLREALAQAMAQALAVRESEALRQREAVVNGFNLDLWARAWRRVVEEW